MSRTKQLAAFLILVISPLLTNAADISGSWTAEFDTQVGKQSYTFMLEVDGMELTGTAASSNGNSAIAEGTVEGETLRFVENMNYQGIGLRIVYTGEIVSSDEINFTRQVGEYGSENFTAQRSP